MSMPEVTSNRPAPHSSAKDGSDPNPEVGSEKWRRVSKNLSFNAAIEIGKSGNGTVVYEGSYDSSTVAVKRLLLSHLTKNSDEIANLSKPSPHSNIVMYYGHECDQDFLYLAMGRCDCNLDDLIQMSTAENFVIVKKHDDDRSTMPMSQEDGLDKDESVPVKEEHFVDTMPEAVCQDDHLEKLKSILGPVKLWKESESKSKSYGRPAPSLLKLMRDMIYGLVHLHESDIIHRDLKPQNILISKETSNLCAKLSDMGISRLLGENKSTLTNNNTNCRTMGWSPPEKLTLGGRQKREMDMFSLGCVLFYCVTRGWHPFGDHDEREKNIKDDNIKNLNLILDFPEAYNLISSLLANELENRPNAKKVLCHPLFWDSEKRLSFLSDTSDQVGKDSMLSEALEKTAHIVLGTEWTWLGTKPLEWNKKVHKMIYVKDKYDFRRVRDLLRLIQNMFNNREQLPQDIQTPVGQSYEEIDDYFTSRFPKLLIEVYKVVDKNCK